MTRKLSIDEFSLECQLPSTGVIVVSSGSPLLEEFLYFSRNTLDSALAFLECEETTEEFRKHRLAIWIHDQWRPIILEKKVRDRKKAKTTTKT